MVHVPTLLAQGDSVIMYILFLLAIKIIPWLPGWMIEAVARIAGLVAWFIATKAREQATQNMLHVLGLQVLDTPEGRRKLRHTVQAMFCNNVLNYLTMFSLAARKPARIMRELHIEGREHFDAAFARGKGVIISSAHVGPFNYLFQWVTLSGYDLTLPVEHLQDPRMLDLITSLRGKHGAKILPLQGSAAMRTLFQKLRTNKAILLTADRAIEGQSSEMTFFGATARLPVGVAQLAKRTGATVVGACGWRTPGGEIYGRFFPITLALPEERATDTDEIQQAILALLEQNIAAHPDQWMAFAPIWTGRPSRALAMTHP
jgi:lauroyl/myristoyl acyltransferase